MRRRYRIPLFYSKNLEKRGFVELVPTIDKIEPFITAKPHKKQKRIMKLKARIAEWKYLFSSFPRR